MRVVCTQWATYRRIVTSLLGGLRQRHGSSGTNSFQLITRMSSVCTKPCKVRLDSLLVGNALICQQIEEPLRRLLARPAEQIIPAAEWFLNVRRSFTSQHENRIIFQPAPCSSNTVRSDCFAVLLSRVHSIAVFPSCSRRSHKLG